MNRILSFSVSICVTLMLCGFFFENNEIDMVKNATLGYDNSVSVGDAFDNYEYFKETKWTTMKDNKNRVYVQCEGILDSEKVLRGSDDLWKETQYRDKNRDVIFTSDKSPVNNKDYRFIAQFLLAKDGKSFSLAYSGYVIDGEDRKAFKDEDVRHGIYGRNMIARGIIFKDAKLFLDAFHVEQRKQHYIGKWYGYTDLKMKDGAVSESKPSIMIEIIDMSIDEVTFNLTLDVADKYAKVNHDEYPISTKKITINNVKLNPKNSGLPAPMMNNNFLTFSYRSDSERSKEYRYEGIRFMMINDENGTHRAPSGSIYADISYGNHTYRSILSIENKDKGLSSPASTQKEINKQQPSQQVKSDVDEESGVQTLDMNTALNLCSKFKLRSDNNYSTFAGLIMQRWAIIDSNSRAELYKDKETTVVVFTTKVFDTFMDDFSKTLKELFNETVSYAIADPDGVDSDLAYRIVSFMDFDISSSMLRSIYELRNNAISDDFEKETISEEEFRSRRASLSKDVITKLKKNFNSTRIAETLFPKETCVTFTFISYDNQNMLLDKIETERGVSFRSYYGDHVPDILTLFVNYLSDTCAKETL